MQIDLNTMTLRTTAPAGFIVYYVSENLGRPRYLKHNSCTPRTVKKWNTSAQLQFVYFKRSKFDG